MMKVKQVKPYILLLATTLINKSDQDTLDLFLIFKLMLLRAGYRNRDLHYFHYYAVRDRVDNNLPTSPPKLPPKGSAKSCALSILPSIDDDRVIRENMIIMVSRVLAKHMESLGFDSSKLVKWHVPHKFQDQMSKKSEVVCTYVCIAQALQQ